MRKIYSIGCTSVLSTLFFFVPFFLSAQVDNLKVDFKTGSSPRNLVVCGDEATVVVTVSTNGGASATRQSIQAQLNLFKGVQLVRFEPSGSSAGVALANSANPNRPVFTLPDLNPNTSSSVNIAYVVKVNCEYIDSLAINDSLNVVDRWDYTYNMGAQNGVKEFDFSVSYRDAMKAPFFTMAVSNNAPSSARVGSCYSRKVVIDNSALSGGWIKGFNYSTSQGPGVALTSILVNGRPVTFTKELAFNTNNDTLVKFIVSDSFFRFNTIGLLPSNGDTLFDSNEAITITENFCIVNCDLARTSTHTMSWGCEGRFCNTISRQDIVRLGQGNANIKFDFNGLVPNIIGGYCQNGRQAIVFINSGVEVDAGTGTMFDIATGIGLGDSFKLVKSGYRITSIKISGVSIPLNTFGVVDIKDNPLFTTDPDGAGGLSDVDGDGFFDDLRVGQKVEITIEYDVDCGATIKSSTEDFCTNNFETAFNAKLDYVDICQNPQKYTQGDIFKPSNRNGFIENCVEPDANTDSRVFMFEHSEVRNVANFERNCGGQEQMLVTVKMPQGVMPVQDSMRFMWFEDTMPLISMTISNDTAFLKFDATKATYLNGEYYLRMGFKADCTAKPGMTRFPTEIAYYCPPCDCKHVWYCDSLKGPRIHYVDPPCLPNVAYDCDKGIKTTDFEVKRTTFGYTDETYATKIDPAFANKNVAMSCDSVQMTVSNVVGNSNILDSMGVMIAYDNITKNDSNRLKDIFTFNKGVLRIVKGGTVYTCNVDATKMRAERTDSTKALFFDLHPCFASLGIAPLSKGDSVQFIGDFAVNPDGPYLFNFDKVPNLRAQGFYVDNDSMYVCDTYGELFRVGRSQALFSFPSSQNAPVGCSESVLEYKLTMFNNDFNKYFKDEFRQSAGVDSIRFRFDPNFVKAFATSIEVSIPDHPIFGDNYFPMPNMDSTGSYVLRFDTLTKVPSLNKLTSHAFNLRIKATPNCATVTGSKNGDNKFDVIPNIYYRDRYYAKDIGDGSCSPYKNETVTPGNEVIAYSNPAVLSFTPITNPSIVIGNDTAEWTVKICNTSDKGNAKNGWISIEPDASVKNFRVVSLKDVTNNTTPINLGINYFSPDSTKAYAFMNGFTPVAADKTIDDVCNVINIKAVVRECGVSKVDFHTGWLCILPTASLWNPAKYAPCTDSVIKAQVRTENPFLDAQFVNQSTTIRPEICDTTELEILLRNTDIGSLYDLKTVLTIPLQGATLLGSDIEIAYPSGSAYKKVSGAPQYLGMSSKGLNYEFADFKLLSAYLNKSGLRGFNPASPSDSNEIKIKFKFLTTCGFKSGSLSYFAFSGKTVCGTPSNFESGESLPILIQGAVLDSSKSFNVNVAAGIKFVPAGVSPVTVNFRNLIATQSGVSDEISVRLPSGVVYRASTSKSIAPATWTPGEPKITMVGSQQVLTWFQPLGLVLNEEATLTFDVNTVETLPCSGSLDIAVATYFVKDVICKTDASVCKTEILTTSNGGEQLFAIPLSRGGILVSSNVTITNNSITILKGDSVSLSAYGAQNVLWIDKDSSKILSNKAAWVYKPTQTVTNMVIKSASALGCVDSTLLRINMFSDTVPPIITVVDTLLKNTKSGDTLTTKDCNKPIYFVLNSVTVKDSFDTKPTLTLDSTIVNGSCKTDGFIVMKSYVWTAKDSSGNTSTYRIFVRITDSIPPVLANVPSNVTISILDPIPTANVTASDNCSGAKLTETITIKSVVGKDTIFSRTWTAVDSCGNTTTAEQIITKIGYTTLTNPVFTDTIYVKDSVIYCLADLKLKGTINYVNNDCPTTSTRFTTVTQTPANCLIIKGLSVGTDTICLTVCTDSSVCTQVKYVTTVLTYPTDSIKITVDIGDSDTICITQTRLKGPLTIKNDCPDSSANLLITFYKDSCLIIKGLNPGTGKICVVICDTLGRCDTTIITVTVKGSSVLTVLDSVDVKGTVTHCFDKWIAGTITRVENQCTASSNQNASYTIVGNCLIIKGLTKGIDTACYLVCTDKDTCVKITFITTVYNKPDSVKTTVSIGQSDTICFTRKTVIGDSLTIKNICIDTTNKTVTYTIKDSCIIIKGITAGTAKSCWVRCDTLGNCDTLIITTVVSNPTTVYVRDTVMVGDSLGLCFDQNFTKGTIILIQNNCPSVGNASYTITGNCLTIKGLKVGQDSACFVICTDSNECKAFTFYTEVIPRVKTDSIKYTVQIGDTDTVCLNFNRPIGVIKNICENLADTTVTYKVVDGKCIEVKGNKLGTSKSCWSICDTAGICDTIILTVLVVDSTQLPIAVDDSTIVRVNKTIPIFVVSNDTINGTLKDVTIMVQPTFGTVTVVDSLGTKVINYVPSGTKCGKDVYDQFVYKLCNENGCDTATVTVNIRCNGLIIYNGISPNADGINDDFTIDGLEDYPNTQVRVYNRWGNQVFESMDYSEKSKWDGTWQGKYVPDGTYFYQIVLTNGETYTGYLQVHR
jgi:gliding motility-associated-like protein